MFHPLCVSVCFRTWILFYDIVICNEAQCKCGPSLSLERPPTPSSVMFLIFFKTTDSSTSLFLIIGKHSWPKDYHNMMYKTHLFAHDLGNAWKGTTTQKPCDAIMLPIATYFDFWQFKSQRGNLQLSFWQLYDEVTNHFLLVWTCFILIRKTKSL